ncbi:uncharacterized protein LOC128681275 isoform X4 [Plodia interpunctella]|uniref:uncharacterized protein LOC128681275 isoform X4 n=1 Tax=Plodia interpunctella TaxID=58824 RepID=UPI0023680657|nr:uncharacterized protein LOC128681275 isoform X4 [Plodia interpunctella]
MTLKSIFLRHCFFLALNIALILAQKPILRSGLPTSLLSRKPILRGGQPLLVEKPILRDGLDLDEDDKNDQLDSSADSYSVPNDRHYSDQRPRKLGGLAQDLSSEELQPTSDLKQELISVLLMDAKLKYMGPNSNADSSSELSPSDGENKYHNTRRRMSRRDCDYMCRDACYEISDVCMRYHCSSKLRSKIEKYCGIKCKKEFRGF